MSDSPALDTLLARLSSLHSAGGFPEFCAAVEEPFSALMGSDVIRQRVDALLARLAAGVDSLPPYSITRHVGAMLFQRLAPLGVLAVRPFQETATIAGAGRQSIIGCLSGEVRIAHYRHAEDSDPSVLDRECALESPRAVVFAPGEHASFEAWRDVTEFGGHGVALVAQSPVRYPTRWAYSRVTFLAGLPGQSDCEPRLSV